jgi:hypothetical protein
MLAAQWIKIPGVQPQKKEAPKLSRYDVCVQKDQRNRQIYFFQGCDDEKSLRTVKEFDFRSLSFFSFLKREQQLSI